LESMKGNVGFLHNGTNLLNHGYVPV
jgi:hypothetical protein